MLFVVVCFIFVSFLPFTRYTLSWRSFLFDVCYLSSGHSKCAVIYTVFVYQRCLTRHDLVAIEISRFVPLTLLGEPVVEVYDATIFIVMGGPHWFILDVVHCESLAVPIIFILWLPWLLIAQVLINRLILSHLRWLKVRAGYCIAIQFLIAETCGIFFVVSLKSSLFNSFQLLKHWLVLLLFSLVNVQSAWRELSGPITPFLRRSF